MNQVQHSPPLDQAAAPALTNVGHCCLPILPDEVIVRIFKLLHWGDVINAITTTPLSDIGWDAVGSEPFLWPADFYHSKGTLDQLGTILQYGGPHFRSLTISQLQGTPPASKLFGLLRKNCPNLEVLNFEQCDCSGANGTDWRKLFTKLRRLSVLRFKKVALGHPRTLTDLAGFITGLQLSYQQHFWGQDRTTDFLNQLPTVYHRLSWLDLSGMQVGSETLSRILDRSGDQLTGLSLLIEESNHEVLHHWLKAGRSQLKSLGLQVSNDMDQIMACNSITCAMSLLLVPNLVHLKLSGHLTFLTLDWSSRFYRALQNMMLNGQQLVDLRINPALMAGWQNRVARIPRDFLSSLGKLKILSLTYPIDDISITLVIQNAKNLKVLQVRTNVESRGTFLEAITDSSCSRNLKMVFIFGHWPTPFEQLEDLKRKRSHVDLMWIYESTSARTRNVSWQHPTLPSRPDLKAISHALMNDFADSYR